MRVFLLRHGIAEPAGAQNQYQDALRALTAEGISKMAKASQGLKRMGVNFDLVASSPLVRARQTAEIVADALRIEESLEIWEELLPEASAESVLEKLGAFRQRRQVLLVGHQPSMGFLASRLIFGKSTICLDFKKGGLCGVELTQVPPNQPATLLWVLPPKFLRLLGDK
ncbi:MAG: phosphohistidine phosphatase SixA [Acidobacteriota bacterium]